MVPNPPPGPDGQEIRMVGVDCSIIMNPKVWVASGHVGGFSDPMVDCSQCKRRFRADKVYLLRTEVGGQEHMIACEANTEAEARTLFAQKMTKLQKKRKFPT